VCAQVKIKFIGPPPSVIDAMGNKASARDMMRAANVPIIPARAPSATNASAGRAKEIGYPLIIKASAGGGGKGMRVVQNDDELLSAWPQPKPKPKPLWRCRSLHREIPDGAASRRSANLAMNTAK
jgi:acetyl-CoA carboxylase biotin carboxylase subunit